MYLEPERPAVNATFGVPGTLSKKVYLHLHLNAFSTSVTDPDITNPDTPFKQSLKSPPSMFFRALYSVM